MATYTYIGFYTGTVGGGIFTLDSSGYADMGSPTVISDSTGDTSFSLTEFLDNGTYEYKGYTAAGEIILYDFFSYYLLVPPGGDTGRSNGAVVSFTAGTFTTCFLRGTLILTTRGEVPVETLRAGDLVVTKFGGLRPIRWIGTQSFHPRFAGPAATPVRFAAGSLGDGVPSADLCVSPGHAMLVGTVLAHAGALVNGSTITQPAFRGESIDYFHLDLGPHDCVLANGAWAESYFEDRNRDSFHNAADFHARFPGHVAERQATCLPIIAAGHPAAAGLQRRLTPVALRRAA